jgi:hypothetical protein
MIGAVANKCLRVRVRMVIVKSAAYPGRRLRADAVSGGPREATYEMAGKEQIIAYGLGEDIAHY